MSKNITTDKNTTVAVNGWEACGKEKRAELTALFNIGADSFNGYIADAKRGRMNVNSAFLNKARELNLEIRSMLECERSERSFYKTTGRSGAAHGGACEVFSFAINGEPMTVVRHLQEGTFILDGMLSNFALITEAELIALAQKGDDLRQFKVELPDGDERVYAGALVGNMSANRQILVYNDGEGLSLVCLHTGKRAPNERCNFAVEVGALSDADKATVRAQLFSGMVGNRRRADRVNVKRAERKAAKSAK